LIAEIKKSSPSAGIIVKNFDHLKIANLYSDNNATCLSVLTEENFFLGNLNYITDIKKKIKLPILAKDFFIDPYQVPYSKSFGCDCILIILSALSEKQADEIYDEALKNKLSVIVEVHDENEAERALKYSEAIIGINNRDLKTLNVSLDNSIRIKKKLTSHQGPLISESGIKNQNDAQYIYDNTGIKNFLIGESLLTNDEPKKLIKNILSISL
jgi:indole-3-glycerol phosphate synthase